MPKTILRLLSALLCPALLAGVFALPSAAEGQLPAISADCAILMDADSGRVIGAKNADQRHAMASTTKIMTALTAMREVELDRVVEIAPAAVGIEGSSVYLYAGEKLTVEDLLYAMLLESANDAAAAIAVAISGSIEAFADVMNETARTLGLTNTHFTNPHGLWDADHYTTARELGLITMHALRMPAFREIVSTYKHTIPLNQTEGVRLLLNHNKMLKLYDGAIGVKTGFTRKSGRCLVSAAERDGVRLIAVTLNAPDDWRDHTAMLDYGFSVSTHHVLGSAGELTYTVPVVGGTVDCVTVFNTAPLAVTLPADAPTPTLTVELPRMLYAPTVAGCVVGRLVWHSGDAIVGESPLVTAYPAEQAAAEHSLADWLKHLFGRSIRHQ